MDFNNEIRNLYFYMPWMNVNSYYRDICNRPEQIKKIGVTSNKQYQVSTVITNFAVLNLTYKKALASALRYRWGSLQRCVEDNRY